MNRRFVSSPTSPMSFCDVVVTRPQRRFTIIWEFVVMLLLLCSTVANGYMLPSNGGQHHKKVTTGNIFEHGFLLTKLPNTMALKQETKKPMIHPLAVLLAPLTHHVAAAPTAPPLQVHATDEDCSTNILEQPLAACYVG
jgi:hypothetical protein